MQPPTTNELRALDAPPDNYSQADYLTMGITFMQQGVAMLQRARDVGIEDKWLVWAITGANKAIEDAQNVRCGYLSR